MQLMYFTEQPMSAYPAEEGLKFGATALMFSNKYFDPVAGSRLYNEYLEHYSYAEEMGIDGFMLNEHHNAPFCMQAKCNIFAAILAAVTKEAKIILLGNPLPLADNPVRLAEELSMIDMISKGRLVSGFVRGGGQEQLAAGVSPAYNRERFEEAHDLIVAAWTREGPFRWEGTHYQHRVVNPWAVPLQKPHPRVWIPGVISPETIVWAAQHGYPYIALNTPIDRTKRIWEIYDNVAVEAGFTPGPDYHGMLKKIHVAETEEKALANAAQFRWMQGEFTGLAHPVWSTPSGYGSPENRRAFVEFATGRSKNPRYRPGLEKQLEELMIIAGTPKTVIAKLRILLEETRPGILGFWGNDGIVSHQDAKTCIRLLGQEVFPAVREMAKEFGLASPFETNQPVSLRYMEALKEPATRRRRSSRPRRARDDRGSGRFRVTPTGQSCRRRSFKEVGGVGSTADDFMLARRAPDDGLRPRGQFPAVVGRGPVSAGPRRPYRPTDTMFLTDDGGHFVRKVTLDGRVLLELGVPGKPAPFMSGEPFHRCTHTALSPMGEIYVSDGYGNARVHKYSPDGKLLRSWGEPGTGEGEFNIVHNICCDADGWVYVADRENHRVQVFDGNGKYETQWKNLHRPCGLYMPYAHQPICYIGEVGPAAAVSRDIPNLGPRSASSTIRVS